MVVEQEVFKLDVTMSNASIVTVANTFDNLLENTFSLFLFQSTIWLGFQVAVQASTTNVFHDQYDILWSVNDLVESDYLLVSHFFHELDLAFDWLSSVGVQ